MQTKAGMVGVISLEFILQVGILQALNQQLKLFGD